MAGHRSFKDLEQELHERPGAEERIAGHRKAAERDLDSRDRDVPRPSEEIHNARRKSRRQQPG